MKRSVILLVMMFVAVAVWAEGDFNAVMRFPPVKLVNAAGYYMLEDGPRQHANIQVSISEDDEAGWLVTVTCEGVTLYRDSVTITGNDVHFVDANFDGYVDIMVGPATARNYSALLVWNPELQRFEEVKNEDLFNGYFAIDPYRRQWVSCSTSSYCSTFFSIMKWRDGTLVTTESLVAISDSSCYSTYGVRAPYTIFNGAAPASNIKREVSKRSALPKVWRDIISMFEN